LLFQYDITSALGLVRWTCIDALDPIHRNEVMRAFGERITLGELQAVSALDAVDHPDVHAVRADHFHVFANLCCGRHVEPPFSE
jgi:hypothetical protein